jgi:hypothetical protein
MSRLAVFTGLLLIATGLSGFCAAGFETRAVTALIPVVFGVLIVMCGILAKQEALRSRALTAASILGMLGFLIPASYLDRVLAHGDSGGEIVTTALSCATAICLGFSVLWVSRISV